MDSYNVKELLKFLGEATVSMDAKLMVAGGEEITRLTYIPDENVMCFEEKNAGGLYRENLELKDQVERLTKENKQFIENFDLLKGMYDRILKIADNADETLCRTWASTDAIKKEIENYHLMLEIERDRLKGAM